MDDIAVIHSSLRIDPSTRICAGYWPMAIQGGGLVSNPRDAEEDR